MKTSGKKIKRIVILLMTVVLLTSAVIAGCHYYQHHLKVTDKRYFDGTYEVIINGEGKEGLRDVSSKEILIGFEYEEIESTLHSNLMEAKKDGKWGLVSTQTFMPLTPFRYDQFYSFGYSVPLVAAQAGDTVYFLDTLGAEQPFRFYTGSNINEEDYISFDDFGLCIIPLVKNEERQYILIDRNGKSLPCGPFADILPNPYIRDRQGDWCGYYTVESLDGGWGVIDTTGNNVLPCIYSEVTMADQEGFIVLQDDTRFLIDFNAQVVDVDMFDEIEDEGEEFTRVWVHGRAGIVDSEGKIVIKPRWDKVYCYRDRVFCASLGEYSFFLNDKDQLVKTP